ncbi:PAS domain S-box protein [Aphanothece sacrum]|uniref:histidine kinase n=1 Tax=Aphanothece sacrum FPU1 TaxID=1920663 RepID=A0A401IID5_APHSA|nr:PAS domain S-box protein [Aphanothece sacrum]GBF81048.1 two-component sensor histidine kinase [Aphanothece sacrum FPU1]GBF85449.1 two-component sensor histidine kinase [Aphanothece sacrum FPU3]
MNVFSVNINLFHLISPIQLIIGLIVVTFFLIYRCFQKEINQRQKAEISLRQQTERERLVNQIAQHIRQSLNLEKVLVTTVADVQEFLQVDRVLIYRIWEDGTGSAITETVSPEYPSILGQTFPEEVFPTEYHQTYSLGKILTITNIDQEEVEPCLVEFVKQFDVKAKLVVPILQQIRENSQSSLDNNPHLWGLLIAHQCNNSRQWQPWEIELMKQLATQVAIAIQQSELHEQLQKLNTELEKRVQERTEELAKTNDSLRDEIVERKRTEAALRHTNYTLQSLIAASPRAIFTVDLEDKVKIWNPTAERMFGWKESEVIDHLNPIISEETVEDYQTIKQAILQGITPSSLELCRPKKDGSVIDIVFSAAPLQDSEGKINGMVAVVADITEQKRQAEQIRLLQSVVVNTKDAVVITKAEPINEPGPTIIYVNEAFSRMTGYTSEEVLGKTPRILQGIKTNRRELDKVKKALQKWESITIEVINYRKDGSEFWMEFSIVPVADKKGYYTHWIGVQRDITKRKSTEEALKRSEERFRSLIENALDIITIINYEGTIYYESPSVEKVLGYPVSQLIGQNFFAYIHPDDFEQTSYSITNAIQNPEVAKPIEFRYQHQDSSWRTLEAISQRFVDDSNESRIVVNSRDITERKRLEEVRLALEREKELSTLKTRFFSMASHEFRTPLSTALAAAQLLENSLTTWDDTEKRLRNLRRIQDSVKNMVQLLDDILMINRAETGKLEFNPQLLDIEKFCRQFVEEIQLSVDSQYPINFVCESDNNQVCLDEKLLRSILANLLSNAIKYSPQGGEIKVSLKLDLETVILQISDQGIGISSEDQKQLFEPFHRGKNVRNISGTGLGLVFTKKCVDLHGGNIAVKSVLDVGTMVTVTLHRYSK